MKCIISFRFVLESRGKVLNGELYAQRDEISKMYHMYVLIVVARPDRGASNDIRLTFGILTFVLNYCLCMARGWDNEELTNFSCDHFGEIIHSLMHIIKLLQT